ncbi:hypothetical protein C1Y63_06915 [Corynebacterium sp. 13CS0277]|uniref:hypothetical protein n=1 Tax=Corynebacterium sp. 13CS0277 TaxID=2071994 RepID=UPI000D02F1FC|nr:hypothetical protein [Corynebacterium sp. 13CS0277]PRQ11276.1 hypothetical protein C1Y63_06915 [Corynebacterium sp. 13CS0277]
MRRLAAALLVCTLPFSTLPAAHAAPEVTATDTDLSSEFPIVGSAVHTVGTLFLLFGFAGWMWTTLTYYDYSKPAR